MKMLAFDLGASSGKLFLGDYDGSSLTLKEVKRFENQRIPVRDEVFWNSLGIYDNLKAGIIQALQGEKDIISIGMDSFSNDFGLIDQHGHLITQVHCYRDGRTKRNEEKIYSKISKQRLHQLCGNQTALFSTLMQLGSMTFEGQSFLLENAGSLLLLPDLFAYFLTGEIHSEYTLSSVSQMMDFGTASWSAEILHTFSIPERILPAVIQPGMRVGKVSTPEANSLGGRSIEVVSVCEHDTASAFLAAPLGADSIIISSGTWSLVGVETSSPIINDYTFQHNIANEGGYPGHHRLLKNVMGHWILQECRRYYAEQGLDFSTVGFMDQAALQKPFQHMIYPDDERFFSAGQMPEKIAEYCSETRQACPDTPAKVMRCVIESLALQYRLVIEELETLRAKQYDKINIVGGGSNNRLLNQCVANATGLQVYAGPIEATALGNLVVQLITYGEIASVTQARQVIQNSFPGQVYEPENRSDWDARYQQYLKMIHSQE